MKELEQKELMEVQGGALKLGFGLVIGGAIVFLIGLIDGFIRPLKCN